MIKRWLCMMVSMLLLGVVAPLSAALSGSGVQDMARYFGADTEFFFSIRIDEGYVSDLNGVVNRVLSNLPAELGLPPELSLRTVTDGVLRGTPFQNYAKLSNIVGNYLAIGMRDIVGATVLSGRGRSLTPDIALFVQLRDRATAETIFKNEAGSMLGAAREISGYTVYTSPDGSVLVGFRDDVMAIVTSSSLLEMPRNTLADDANFKATIAALPAPSYNILLNFSGGFYRNVLNLLNQQMPMMDSIQQPLDLLENVTGIAIGFTIVDGRTLAMDIVGDGLTAPYELKPLSAEYTRLIPSNTAFVVAMSNVSQVVSETLKQLSELSAEFGQTDPMSVVRQFSRLLNLDFDTEVLPLFDGDTVLFTTLDIDALLNVLRTGELAFAKFPLELGLVVRPSDISNASQASMKLVEALKRLAANTTNVTFEDVQAGTLITIKVDASGITTLDVPLYIGLGNGFVFFGTFNAFERLFAGDVLAGTAEYADAQTVILPNSNQVLYFDDGGAATLAAISVVGVLEPIVDDFTENINRALMNPNATPEAMPDTSARNARLFGQFDTIVKTVSDLIAHSTVSSSIEGSVVRVRLTITLK